MSTREASRGADDQDRDDDDMNEEEDDRKPPAREVVVRQTHSSDEEEEEEQRRGGVPRDLYSADESVISGGTTSSMMTPQLMAPDHHSIQLVGAPPSTNKLVGTSMTPPHHHLAAAASAVTGGSLMTTTPSFPLTPKEYENLEKAMRQRIYTFAGSILLSLSFFLYIILPFYALVALAAAAASAALAANEVYQYALVEYDHRARHTGFGDLLPDRVFRILTQQSLHEFIMSLHGSANPATSFNRFFVIYFLPGLTPEQRNAYIQRLPRRHRQMLERPGVGQILGPTFMRLLIGEDRYDDMTTEGTSDPAAPPRPTAHRRRRVQLIENPHRSNRDEERRAIENAVPAPGLRQDHDDESSDLGLDIDGNDMVGGLTADDQEHNMSRSLGLQEFAVTNVTVNATIPEEEEDRDDDEDGEHEEEEEDGHIVSDEEETRIIVEAAIATMWAQLARVTRPFTRSAMRMTTRASRNVAANMASYGVGLATLVGGVGVVGYLTSRDGQRVATSALSGTGLGGMLRTIMYLPTRERGEGGHGLVRQGSIWATIVLGSGAIGTLLFATNRMVRSTSTDSVRSLLSPKKERKDKEK